MDIEPDVEKFRSLLAMDGFDVVHAVDVRWYNAHIKEHSLPLNPLPTKFCGVERPEGALCFLVGNSAALWPKFLEWLGNKEKPEDVVDPLDDYSTECISEAIWELTREGDISWDTFYVAGEVPERLVSMQRVALTAGLCYHDAETQLAIHPTFGAWVAFRAVVVIDAPSGLGATPPPRLDCLLGEEEKAAAREAMAAALRASDEANLCTQLHGEKGMETDVRLAWAKLRDCVRVGREHRYSEEQLVYHYTKDKAVLMRAVKQAKGEKVTSDSGTQTDAQSLEANIEQLGAGIDAMVAALERTGEHEKAALLRASLSKVTASR